MDVGKINKIPQVNQVHNFTQSAANVNTRNHYSSTHSLIQMQTTQSRNKKIRRENSDLTMKHSNGEIKAVNPASAKALEKKATTSQQSRGVLVKHSSKQSASTCFVNSLSSSALDIYYNKHKESQSKKASKNVEIQNIENILTSQTRRQKHGRNQLGRHLTAENVQLSSMSSQDSNNVLHGQT